MPEVVQSWQVAVKSPAPALRLLRAEPWVRQEALVDLQHRVVAAALCLRCLEGEDLVARVAQEVLRAMRPETMAWLSY